MKKQSKRAVLFLMLALVLALATSCASVEKNATKYGRRIFLRMFVQSRHRENAYNLAQ